MRDFAPPAPRGRGNLRLRTTRALRAAACAMGALVGCAGDGAPERPASAPAVRVAESGSGGTRGFWLGDDAARAQALLAALSRAADDGLDPEGYGASALARALEGGMDAAALEPALDAAFLRYAADLRHGQVRPEGAEPLRHVRRPPVDPAALRALIESWSPREDLAAVLRPPGEAYSRVQVALSRYRGVAAAGGWPGPPPPPTLHVADPDAPPGALAALRARLSAEDARLRGAPADPGAARGALIEALRAFQSRHGLSPDGVVGAATRAALAVPADARAAQLVLALERLRWPDASRPPQGIEVNVPDASLVLYDRGSVVLRSRVVVGQPDWATPVFSTRTTGVLFHPAWNVPASIARRELVAKVREDPTYLGREGMELMTVADGAARVLDPAEVDWNAPGAVRLRQRPGPRNALGLLKFQMPNRYAVFLHDTPQREFFGRDRRALSHGCVRVERARELAGALLPGRAPQVDALLGAGQTREVAFRRPVPVRIVYRTAWVDDDGAVHFRPDVYGYDADLARTLRLPARAPPANNAAIMWPRPGGDHG